MLFSIITYFCALTSVTGLSIGKFARVVSPEIASNQSYDFIIAGGGVAGLTVADRLTEDPNISVLVIEYGPFDKGEDSVLVPGSYNPGPYLWPALFSTPQEGLLNKTFFVPIGCVVGGGSTVNAMFLHRGSHEDYDAWKAPGSTAWGWDDLLSYFRKAENFTRPDPAFAAANNISWDDSVHGSSGPIHSSYAPYDYAPSGNLWEAALDTRISKASDPNNGKVAGIHWLLRALDPDSGTRSYARLGHYERVITTRPNYHLLAENAVAKILFEGKKAVGIEYVTRSTGIVSQVYAKKEVVVSAGAVHTPQILQLSGVGPRELLEGLGIEVVVELPGVGQNFHDQLDTKVNYNFTSNISPNSGDLDTNATYDAEQRAIYDSEHKGAYTLIRGTGNNFINLPLKNATTTAHSIIQQIQSQDPAEYLPPGTHPTVIAGYKVQRENILTQFAGYNSPIGTVHWNTGPQTTLYLLKPLSRGSINIASTDPLANPLINFASLTNPVDIELVLALYKKNREIMLQPSMQILGPIETSPAPGVTDDEQLKALIKQVIAPSNAHQCCTAAKTKLDLGGVVDENLLVYGVKGLSVIDASIFPFTPAGAPSVTVYASAEKAADIIKKRHDIRV